MSKLHRVDDAAKSPMDFRILQAESPDRNTRIVHLLNPGRYYLERTVERDGVEYYERQPINIIRKAVAMALTWVNEGGRVYLGRLGGTVFDAQYKRALEKDK